MARLRPRIERNGRLAVNLQALGQRLSFVILICAAMVLLLVGRGNSERLEGFRAVISDISAPLLELASMPLQAVRTSFEGVNQYYNTVEENQRLRREVERLTAWHTTALKLQQENKEFRSMLNVHDLPEAPYVSARVIGDLGSPFVHTVLINAGIREGVKKDMPVVGAEGLIGRVVSAGNRVSRVLLLSDLNSRVPVRLESSGYQSVLAGDNEKLPQLFYLPANAKVKPGDRLITSGHGGVFPPGIPVGSVSRLDGGSGGDEVRVKTFADENRLSFVRVLQYQPLQSPADSKTEKTPANEIIGNAAQTPAISPVANPVVATVRGQ